MRDVRQLLVHRHKQVQARTRTKNQLQAMALSSGVQKKRKLWSKAGREELEQLPLLPYAAERRKRLLETLDSLEAEIGELDRRVAEEAGQRREPGAVDDASGSGSVVDSVGDGVDVGTGGEIRLGQAGGQLLWPDPESEASSGGKQRLGRISKQGSSFLRFLLVEQQDRRRRATIRN